MLEWELREQEAGPLGDAYIIIAWAQLRYIVFMSGTKCGVIK